MMDFTVINDCKLGRVYEKEVKRNDEVVGRKHYVEVLTWGDKVTVEVDSGYAKELKLGVIGKATIVGSIVSRSELRHYDGRSYATDFTYFQLEKLGGFEPANSKQG
ncbi:MAG: hypothetical protein PHH77_02290 [Victivallaceae bacterium]|nr:hypothetical protein [Victivallaceae bacterium]MDD5697421.1 hypothetical protein [Victivallaceae bacterium]